MDLWQEMGLEGRRALIVHHDDLGITHAQTQAYLDLGYPTGSLLASSTWAPALAGHEGGDLGVHLTLTSEWNAPRIRPLTGGASLRDAHGFFWRTLEEVWRHAETAEVEAELRAQVEAIYALGIDVTHIDTHMGAVMRPDVAEVYVRLAAEYLLPIMLPARLEYHSLPEAFREPLRRLLDASPLPRVGMLMGYDGPAETMRDWYVETLRGLGPGVYHLIHHAALPTPEGRMLPDWERRAADVDALQDPEVRGLIGECVPLTYREVRDALRAHLRKG
ncbi:MAG: ChbG/HpnK family deacetylase [Chloroflexi bacterium]|nr:ChbG/HpnK family deacetylase [Chloroflexota bacterium]